MTRPVLLQDAPEVQEALIRILKGWIPVVEADDPAKPPVSTVVHTGDGVALSSAYLLDPLTTLPAASAACGVIADIGQDYLEERSGCYTLQCGAFSFRNRRIAVTGPNRAGKSTLISRLTTESDMQVWCDAMLPTETDGLAVGLWVVPRLRLPLPAQASPFFKDHVARWLGPHDDRYGCLCAPTVAPHGSRAELAALIVLDRRPDGPARLHRLAPDAAIHHLPTRNMSDLQSPGIVLIRVRQMAERMICLQMVYSDLENAVALLRRAFGGEIALNPDVELGEELPLAPESEGEAAAAAPGQVWQRQQDIMIRRYGASSFLWRPGGPMLWQLNTVVGAVWNLLKIPGSAIHLAEVLSESFPDIPIDQWVSGIAGLLGALASEGLVSLAD